MQNNKIALHFFEHMSILSEKVINLFGYPHFHLWIEV